MSASAYLQKELKELHKSMPIFNIDLVSSNILLWDIGFYISNKDSKYYGAYLKGQMRFPQDYPFQPPTFRFIPTIFHPNVYRDGRLCISILHSAGGLNDEPSNENWSPAQCVESVLLSIISLLDDPNINSPANVDASKLFRDHKDQYYEKVKQDVENSKLNIPEDYDITLFDDNLDSNGDDITNSNQGINHGNSIKDHIDEDNWDFDEADEEDDYGNYDDDDFDDDDDDEIEEDEFENDEENDDESFVDRGHEVEMSEDYGEADSK
ncbi:unnamed protein product [[Candida] boidinii]|uniref:Unnamed protein product n=1 Tax=Candida boidinii TaxID=5477 RepID=A0A9W6SW26_CANBO|nr:hypothetical protein B5S30_g688 [[Candida] boidinii]OWB82274.1 hypothetical protein B5S33_g898 [[Candida] boidinii]GME68201.1 unnamed protein product [[Candida] boidinii]GMG00051.1 unnamed protein product [[Candida] boidinii]